MVEDIGGSAFPVVLFDGMREIDVGSVDINPMMDFKTFQVMLSQQVGLSPNQISIYLCDRKADRKRIPITGKVNFAFIAREKDCFFLAVVKRSRKSRNRKAKVSYGDYLSDNEFVPSHPPENLILLRRNQPELNVNMNLNMNVNPSDSMFPGFGPAYYERISQAELAGLNDRFHNLQIQRENYAMAMARSNPNPVHLGNPNPSLELDPNSFPRIQDSYSTTTKRDRVTCKECSKAAEFHPCVLDPIIKGWFRTRFGPIKRPTKTSR